MIFHSINFLFDIISVVMVYDNKKYKDDCSICFEALSNSAVTTTIECNHNFHSQCLNLWVRTSSTCPLCRHTLATRRVSSECSFNFF